MSSKQQYNNVTPFAAAKIANVVLTKKGLDAEVKPQMMYSYAKKGIIQSNYETRTDGEKIYFDGAAFKQWLDKYIVRIENGESGSSRVDYDVLAEQFMTAEPVELVTEQ
jgi:phage terminase Nu1 subunit (DNA packaging protein)